MSGGAGNSGATAGVKDTGQQPIFQTRQTIFHEQTTTELSPKSKTAGSLVGLGATSSAIRTKDQQDYQQY